LWLAFWGRAIGSPELAEIQRSRQSQLVTMFDEALARRGEPADAEARRAESQRLIALLDGIAVQATFLPEHWPPDRQLAYFADVLGG